MISVDALGDNTAFAKKENADFPILADPTKETAKKYGVLRSSRALGAVANRWTFYVGSDGKILNIDKQVSPGTSGADIVSNLKTFKVPAAKK